MKQSATHAPLLHTSVPPAQLVPLLFGVYAHIFADGLHAPRVWH
jgi:hypothetical protein